MSDDDHSTLARIIGERTEKAAALRASGRDPYRNDFKPSHAIAALRDRYEPTKPPPAPRPEKGQKAEPGADPGITPIDGEVVRIAGRALAKRGFGKTVFAPIRDGSAQIQLYLSVDHLDGADFEHVLPQLDVGDIVAAEGRAFWTKRGEL